MNINLQFASEGWAGTTAKAIKQLAEEFSEELNDAVREGRFPRQAFEAMGKAGLLGSITSKEYGGMGGGVPEYCFIEEECGRRGLVSAQTQIQGQCWLRDWGTPAQKERYLPGMASGELIFSESISEPGAASSLKSLRTTATPVDGGWVIRGDKCHINMGVESDVTLVYAMAPEGLTAFLVDTDVPTLKRRATHPIGMRSSPTADMHFEDVRIGKDAVLGEPGDGLATFLSTFNVSRLGNASQMIGFARRALADGIAYARSRMIGSSAVSDLQGNQWTIADCYSALYAASLARDQAANLAQSGGDPAFATSLAKYLAVTSAEKATSDVYALIGGHGLYEEQPYGQHILDVKLLRVAGGSLEVLKNFVAKSVLKSSDLAGLD